MLSPSNSWPLRNSLEAPPLKRRRGSATQRKEMVHNALTGGKALRQCRDRQSNSRGRLARSHWRAPAPCPSQFGAPDLLPHPHPLLQPLLVDHVPFAPPPDLPNSVGLRQSLGGLQGVLVLYPNISSRILSNVFSPRVLDSLHEKHKQKLCFPLQGRSNEKNKKCP